MTTDGDPGEPVGDRIERWSMAAQAYIDGDLRISGRLMELDAVWRISTCGAFRISRLCDWA